MGLWRAAGIGRPFQKPLYPEMAGSCLLHSGEESSAARSATHHRYSKVNALPRGRR
jgi:hypothetical protein